MKLPRPLRFSGLAFSGLACALALTGPASAVTTYQVSGALDDGGACLSSSAAGSCAANYVFDVRDSYAVTGTLVYDEVAGTVDIDITLTTGEMDGLLDSVRQVVFTDTNYQVDDYAVFAFGGQLLGLGNPTGSVVGTYTEFAAGGVPVGGPTAFPGQATDFTALSCLVSGSNGQCGFTVGANRDFNLPVAGQGLDFRHTFNFGVTEVVIPEPSAAVVFAVGLLVLRRRVARG